MHFSRRAQLLWSIFFFFFWSCWRDDVKASSICIRMLTLLTGRGNLSLSVYKMGVKIISPHLRELFWVLNELTHKKSSEWCVAEWGNAHWALAVAAAGLWGPTLKECACSVMYNSSVAPWTVALQAPLSVGFFKQECWSGLPFPSPGAPPNSGLPYANSWPTEWVNINKIAFYVIKPWCGSWHLGSKQNNY